MNREQEITFIQSFISRGRRERTQLELLSEKKRVRFLSSLCHNYDRVLDDRYLNKIPKPNSDYETILELLKQEGASDTCYAISANDEIDGETLKLSDALEKAVGFGLPSILICIPGKLAYFEAEQTAGSPPRYLLKKR
jgi:hypothetical protein